MVKTVTVSNEYYPIMDIRSGISYVIQLCFDVLMTLPGNISKNDIVFRPYPILPMIDSISVEGTDEKIDPISYSSNLHLLSQIYDKNSSKGTIMPTFIDKCIDYKTINGDDPFVKRKWLINTNPVKHDNKPATEITSVVYENIYIPAFIFTGDNVKAKINFGTGNWLMRMFISTKEENVYMDSITKFQLKIKHLTVLEQNVAPTIDRPFTCAHLSKDEIISTNIVTGNVNKLYSKDLFISRNHQMYMLYVVDNHIKAANQPDIYVPITCLNVERFGASGYQLFQGTLYALSRQNGVNVTFDEWCNAPGSIILLKPYDLFDDFESEPKYKLTVDLGKLPNERKNYDLHLITISGN